MLPPVKGKVKRVQVSDRVVLDKDGVTKKNQHITKIQIVDTDSDHIVLTTFDENFVAPKEGDAVSYQIRRYECLDGMTQTGMI